MSKASNTVNINDPDLRMASTANTTSNCVFPPLNDPYFPYIYPSTGISVGKCFSQQHVQPLSKWLQSHTTSGPCFTIDLPGVPVENVRLEIKDERYLMVHYRRDDNNSLSSVDTIDLHQKLVDVSSAEATFKLCVLKVHFKSGLKVPNVRQLPISF